MIHNKHSCSHNKQESVNEKCLNVSSDETIPTVFLLTSKSFTHIDDRDVTKREKNNCWAPDLQVISVPDTSQSVDIIGDSMLNGIYAKSNLP